MKPLKPVGIKVVGETTVIKWNDDTTTIAIPDGKDEYDYENGVLWALLKRFMDTSTIISVIQAGKG